MNFSDPAAPVDAAIFGASGGLGHAFVHALQQAPGIATIHAVARCPLEAQDGVVGYPYSPDEDGIKDVIAQLPTERLGLALVCIGTLHDQQHGPEKSMRQFDEARFLDVMRVNAVLPALIGKAMMPVMKRQPFTFAALSARVGSISDNRLGGWHSYRASKTALNMLVRNIAIEAARVNPDSIAVTLHPGTVDTALSKPFQSNVPEGKLFSPAYSAGKLLDVLARLSSADTGKCFDYAGHEIAP